jgi:hypothetical protein
MSFNIGSQNAGNINNVAGDQHIHGGQFGVAGTQDAIDALSRLRAAIDSLPAAAHDQAVRADVDRIDQALNTAGQPDRPAVSSALDRLTHRLGTIGALTTAGAALVGPLRDLAGWLGPLAGNVLTMLPG